MTIIITHTPVEGTLIEGSRKGDGVYGILLGLRSQGQGNWRYFRSLNQIGLGQSRDKQAQKWKIDKAAEALRDAGFDVEVEIDDTRTRPFAEAEQERYERAEDRAWYHDEQADKAAGEADARWQAERRIRDTIPMGQPILRGHHSEGRHRRDLARADNHARKGLEAVSRSEYHAERASAAEWYEAGRKSLGTTLRRIEKMEADRRRLLRSRDGAGRSMYGQHEPATGRRRERLDREIASLDEQIAHWKKHVADLEASGVKVWTKDDFAKGDFVRIGYATWYEVIRVNQKSLTLPARISGPGKTVAYASEAKRYWTDTVPYHQVTGRKTPEEMEAALAEASGGPTSPDDDEQGPPGK